MVDPTFPGGLKVLACCGLLWFQIFELVGRVVSTLKGLGFCFCFCRLFVAVIRHQWAVCFRRVLVFWFCVFKFEFGVPSFGGGSCLRRRLVGMWSCHSGGWCLFGLLVVGATGCSSLVSGMFFVYDRHW
jgi:hypothetical protein